MFVPDAPLSAILLHLIPILGMPLVALLLGVLPGWWAARRLVHDSGVAMIVAGLCSFLLVYLSCFVTYLSGVSQMWAIALLALPSGISIFEMLKHRGATFSIEWRLLVLWYSAGITFVGLQVFIFAPGAPMGMWDWAEHWIRSKVFLENQPLKTTVGGYSMAARGPLFNAFEAVCMSLFGNKEYWCYQLIASALNTWYVIPFCVALRQLCGVSNSLSLAFAALSGIASFDITSSIIYPWTKIFVAGLILGSFVVYLSGLENRNRLTEAIGLTGFSIAFLAHYLAFPFAIFMWAHFAITRCIGDLSRLRSAALALLASAAIVSSWFVPCFLTIGFKETLSANTTIGSFYVTTASGGMPDYWKTVIFNMASSFLPFKAMSLAGLDDWVPAPAAFLKWWVVVWHDGRQVQQLELPELRTPQIFSGFLSSFGSVGSLVAIAVLGFAFLRKLKLQPLHPIVSSKFWWLFWTVGIFMNVATIRFLCVGGINGSAHAYSMLLLILVMGFADKLPSLAKITAVSVITGNVTTITARIIAIESIPIQFVNNQPQAVPNTKIFVWHLQNAAFKAQNNARLLFDLLENDRIPIAIATVVFAIALVLWIALKTEQPTPRPASSASE
jgi:hypothetical protein